MMLALNISAELEATLRARAAAAGQSLEGYLTAWLERELAWESTHAAWQPASQANMSDESLSTMLEAEKHAMRREKRAS